MFLREKGLSSCTPLATKERHSFHSLYSFVFLHCIKHLLLDLLKLILHLNDDVLHLSLIALRAGCIDLTSHFLSNETEFLALTALWLCHSLAEVVEVVGEALFLLRDVKLLDVVDKLLLKAVLVVVDFRNLLQSVDDALTDFLHTRVLDGSMLFSRASILSIFSPNFFARASPS